ncbi:MAG: MerR family transcriptional regulator [Planctomycetes bacterium]|nr:MerR family transcriptional regulator [Planctomycetota bacterium]
MRSNPTDRREIELLRTSDVLEQTGITHQVLYRYVTLGLIEPAKTTQTGQRYFHPRVLIVIDLIKSLTEGRRYTLREIKEIFFKDKRVRKILSRT